MDASWILLGILVVLVVYVIYIYNRLVAFRNRVRNGFAQIDVQLQRRYDLIPNLVETAKGYLKHERETLTGVIEARNQAKAAEERAREQPEDGAALRALSQAEGGLSAALGRLFALNESYPDLKADGTMRDLMEELSSTENKVSFARQHFNDAVMYYNTYREQFPNNLVANNTGFKVAEQLELEDPEAAREPVRVSFG
ncbi:MAG: LemA family protein [Halofilum sp. (in: g-proteobacteria)]|nr:LemA family protein [Halofilum sp. (in: g-proteobacteria)]